MPTHPPYAWEARDQVPAGREGAAQEERGAGTRAHHPRARRRQPFKRHQTHAATAARHHGRALRGARQGRVYGLGFSV